MRRIKISSLLLGVWLLVSQSCGSQAVQLQDVNVATPESGQAQTLVAGHSAVSEFDTLPADAVEKAAGQRLLFIHASTGMYMDQLGLEFLQATRQREDPVETSPYSLYFYDRRNWNLPLWRYDAFSEQKNILEKVVDKVLGRNQLSWIKMDEFKQDVASFQDQYDVIGMKLCYLDWKRLSWTQYRDMLLSMEAEYPEKVFIWSTAPLQYTWDEPESPKGAYQSIHNFNERLRAYALAENKPLFDIADIESHREDGSTCVDEAGREILCPEYHNDELGHPNWEGSIRLAKGFWWLITNISAD